MAADQGPSVLARSALCGGNQKVALALGLSQTRGHALARTQGVDVGSEAEIHALMQTVRPLIAIIMISSELPHPRERRVRR